MKDFLPLCDFQDNPMAGENASTAMFLRHPALCSRLPGARQGGDPAGVCSLDLAAPDSDYGFFQVAPEQKRGEVLIATDDLSLVLPLRQALMREAYDLTWTNNFWMAISYLHNRTFSSLALDVRLESVQERFLLHFLEECDLASRGRKVFFNGQGLRKGLKKEVEGMGHVVLPDCPSSQELVAALNVGGPGSNC